MIDFNFNEVSFNFNVEKHLEWLQAVIASEDKTVGEITYIFCTDDYLLQLNKQFLNHDTLTDIITFDNSIGSILGADIFISTERVADNALDFEVEFSEELRRVLVHGVLHLCGYKDKSDGDQKKMTLKEDEKLSMFHVEHS
ncbi:rRNA maturation RNase YbeY [Aquimarina agarivorans]|uniref:rRNA maturation RNase YbeY n=1 Tax=Aquimarina agarivorans TaxID=980584 RepID=UPI000248F2B5|nr:rRNA maturation RNase YbeY [Aquimarina agarivorans]